MLHIPVSPDKLLSDLVIVMDQSDVEYAAIMKELKTEIFDNRCRQERLREHLWNLQKKESILEERSDQKGELCSNHGHQEKLREQLEGLEKRLRMVEATATVEEYLQNEADEVSCVWCQPTYSTDSCIADTVCACVT